MQKTRFIFNPHSGHNARNPALLARTRAFISEHHLPGEVVLTERPHHATELARRAIADHCQMVVAIGGDGTMNEVASALVGTDVVLGLVPCGSGNGLGRHLGIPGPGQGAFRTLLNGEIRAIDTGMANGLPFFNAMGLGFDAEISYRFNRLSRRGLSSYFRTTVGALAGFRPETYTIRNDGSPMVTSAFIVSVANSDQYGNNCFIAPGARVDDGRLDVTVLTAVDFFNALPLTVRLFTKLIGGSPSVQRLQGANFVIERSSPGLVHTDGETYQTSATVTVSVLPKSLRVLVPKKSFS